MEALKNIVVTIYTTKFHKQYFHLFNGSNSYMAHYFKRGVLGFEKKGLDKWHYFRIPLFTNYILHKQFRINRLH